MATQNRIDKDRLDKDSIDKDRVIGEGTKRFHAPTLEEVKTYCLERNNSVDPQRFIDYYESVGWKVGKNPMKDWKAAVRTWERNDRPKQDDDFDAMAKRIRGTL